MLKRAAPAANPDAYVTALDGWRRECVEVLRATVRTTSALEEVVKWGHLVYLANGPVLLIRAEEDRVLFGFWRGQRLRAIEPRLKRGGKYEMATLELREGMTVKPATVRRLTRAAAGLNQVLGDPTLAAKRAIVTNSSRSVGVVVAVCLAVAGVSRCAGLGYSNRVLWRVASPNGQIVAVCQEVPAFDGPGYDVRLERPEGGLMRHLYGIGDGDPCTEVVWSPDGRTLAVLSGQVARVRFVDIGWALDHPEVQTAHWSWRQVDFSTERARVEGSDLRFVGPTTIELRVCSARSGGSSTSCGSDSLTRRSDIPVPIVTGHR